MSQEEYDELYSQGFNDGIEDSEENITEEESEELEQPTEEEEVQPEETLDEEVEEATDEPEEDSDDTENQEDVATDEEESNEDDAYLTIERFGEKINLTREEAQKMSQLGWDYTSKTQDLATQRKRLEIIDGLPDEVLQALKDTSSGNIEAFATIANQFNIDPFDVDGAGDYKPQIIEKNYELEDVVNEIKADSNSSNTIDTWMKELPNSVNEGFANNPNILRGLHVDLKQGVANKIMPEVIKTLKLNPTADFVQTYQSVGQKMLSTREEKPAKPEASREIKKKATPVKVKSSKHMKDHESVWDDNDLFMQMRKKAGLV